MLKVYGPEYVRMSNGQPIPTALLARTIRLARTDEPRYGFEQGWVREGWKVTYTSEYEAAIRERIRQQMINDHVEVF